MKKLSSIAPMIVLVVLTLNLFSTTQVLAAGWPAPSFGALKSAVGGDFTIVGDFNHDGKLDLVALTRLRGTGLGNLARDFDKSVLGNGNGTFRDPVSFSVGANPLSGVAADLDGDGNLDLIVADSGTPPLFVGPPITSPITDGGVSVLLGKGDGTFQVRVEYGSAGSYSSCAVGDFNGDGKLDLAVAKLSGLGGPSGLWVFLGRGDGTFQDPAIQPSPEPAQSAKQLVAVDLDGDGKLDLALATGPNLLIFLGKGDGTFQTAASYPVTYGGGIVLRSDFNADGKPDFLAGNGGGFSILLGKGDGMFATPFPSTLLGGGDFNTGDFDGDGKLDLAVVGIGNTYILPGLGDGTFPLPPPSKDYSTAGTARQVRVADFNRDGLPDLAVLGDTQLAIHLSNPEGTLQPAVNYPAGTNATAMAIADFNGDGKPDVAVANIADLSMFAGKGDGSFTLATNLPPLPTSTPAFPVIVTALAAGDFDHDGRMDLAAGSSGTPFGFIPYQQF